MKQLIKQAVSTLARFGNSKKVVLLKVENIYTGIVIGAFLNGEILFPNEAIKLNNTPLEKIINTKKTYTYPGTLVKSIPFPIYQNPHSDFSCVCLPLLSEKNQVIGVIILDQKVGISLSSERLYVLNLLRPLITAIIEMDVNMKEIMAERENLLQLSTTDSLTGLYTQRYFETRLQEEFSKVCRHGGVFSLLLIDIDHFKQVNDTCGYKEGNRVLQEVAKLLNNSIRKEIDILCRYSGKQFGILLPHTDVDGAYILAERIRRSCEQHSFTTQQGVPFKVTLSIGVAHNIDIAHGEELHNSDSIVMETTSVKEVSKEEVIYRVDVMLNAAKQAGHNQVMVWW
jgi:diguanylate cyclase (GGDEF)-like protein